MVDFYLDDQNDDYLFEGGAMLFYTPDQDEIGFDIALNASDGTLLFEDDVAGSSVYLVANGPKRLFEEEDECSTADLATRWKIADNLTADVSHLHEMLTTAEYLDDLVDGEGNNAVIVIDFADEFFTLDGPLTMERVAEWACANGALIVAVHRTPMAAAVTIH